MSTLLFFDFDGVLNPVPFESNWIGTGKISELDIIFANPTKWETVELPIDPDIFFAPDMIALVNGPMPPGIHTPKYTIRWSSELIDNINTLVSKGNTQFNWLTSWQEYSQTILAPTIGLDPSWKWMPWTRRFSDYNHYGKYEALVDLIESGERRSIVWVDDVATEGKENFSGRSINKLERKDSSVFDQHNVPSLVIQTDTRFGISRAQWEAIEKFVADNS